GGAAVESGAFRTSTCGLRPKGSEMRRSLVVTISALAVLLPTSLAAQEVRHLAAGQAPGAATIADVAWLEGRWVGEGLGGAAEETYSPPAGGAMIGAFRSLKADGQPNFYEFVLLAEREGS